MTEDDSVTFIDATEEFQRYRLMLRGIWNSYICTDRDMRDWDMRDRFNEITPALAEKLLGEKLRRRLDVDDIVRLSVFVVPAVNSIGSVGQVPIRISETFEKQTSRNWDQPPMSVAQRDMAMIFRDFFDWDPLGYRDMQYFLVEISASCKFPELIGRDALIEVLYARVLVFPGTVTDDELRDALDKLIFVQP